MPAKKQKVRTLGYVSLQLDGKTTDQLREAITKSGVVKQDQYKTVKDEKNPAHVTLAFHTDEGFAAFVDAHYKQHEHGKSFFKMHIDGFVHDEHCVALVVDTEKFELSYLPPDKKLHVTMMLNNKPPVYSNELLSRNPVIVPFNPPISINGRLQFHYIYM